MLATASSQPITMYWASQQGNHVCLHPRRPLGIPQQRYSPAVGAAVVYDFIGQPLIPQRLVYWMDEDETVLGGHNLGPFANGEMPLGRQALELTALATRTLPITSLMIVRTQASGEPAWLREELGWIVKFTKRARDWHYEVLDWLVVSGKASWRSARERHIIPPRIRHTPVLRVVMGALLVLALGYVGPAEYQEVSPDTVEWMPNDVEGMRSL